jgi:hypothetical protein
MEVVESAFTRSVTPWLDEGAVVSSVAGGDDTALDDVLGNAAADAAPGETTRGGMSVDDGLIRPAVPDAGP